ncbi:MAG: signal peptidase I [Nitrospiraceae bacterium]
MQRTAPIDGGRSSWPWIWAPIGALTVLVYLAVNFAVVRLVPGGYNVYLAQPALWSYLALMAFLFWKYGITDKPSRNGSVIAMAILLGFFNVAIFLIAGLLLGFGASPYGHGPPALLGNALFAISSLLAIEMARACVIGSIGTRRPTLALVAGALFFSLVSIPLARYGGLNEGESLLRFSGETILPTISENLLASFLVLLGGPVASIAYRGILIAFEWLSPILPDLEWIAAAFLGTMAPALGLLVLRNRTHSERSANSAAHRRSRLKPTLWFVLAAITVTLLFFNTGLLGVSPTLVSGASMYPMMKPGDLAITKDVPAEAVRVGDVIRFRVADAFVLHRVVEVQGNASEPSFITQGDANNVEDPPVAASQLEGKVILVVPKIGWVSISAHRLIESFESGRP